MQHVIPPLLFLLLCSLAILGQGLPAEAPTSADLQAAPVNRVEAAPAGPRVLGSGLIDGNTACLVTNAMLLCVDSATQVLPEPATVLAADVKRLQLADGSNMWISALQDQDRYYEREVSWKQWASLGALFMALALLISTLLYALWWVPRRLYEAVKPDRDVSPHLYVRALPLVATLAFFATVILFVMATRDVTALGEMTAASVGFTVSSLLFAVLSIASLVVAVRSFRRPAPALLRWHALLVSLALCGLTVFFTYWRIIGLQLWSW